MVAGLNVERERLALLHLETALEWPAAERAARLGAAMAHDPLLLAEVRELLAAATAAGDALPTHLPLDALPDDSPPPERIGPYRLGELLGRGGMGRVYRAARDDGLFEQEVAIKLTRRSRLAARVAEQFARERRILARLQHRNIAQLFDGGVTDAGDSFFVMELVAGRSVTEFADERHFDVRSRLQLFRQIAGAVQHAHARLVVHADLKPSNVIVTADGTAKLLDFGVARALADAAEPDATRPLGLTPDYASPARRRGEPPCTADDVYSLGVLLDELLRACEPLEPDLRSVIARARAEDPARRYTSVDALQDDLQRWLAGRPVEAHGRGFGYLVRRLVARHRLAAAVAAVSVLLLAGAATALAVLYVQAERARVQAEQRFDDLRSLSRFVLFDVYDRLARVPRSLTLRRDLADAGQRYLDRLARDPRAPVAVQLEVIEGLRRLAQVQSTPGAASLALAPLARQNLDRAQALAEGLRADGADAPTRSLVLARVLIARARLGLAVDAEPVEAERALVEAARLLEPLAAAGTAEAAELLIEEAALRAEALQWRGRYAESVEVARTALARPAWSGKEDARAAALRRARLLDLVAEGTYYGGDAAGAEAPYREQYALLADLAAREPHDLDVARRLQRAGWALGTTLVELRRPAQAEPILAASATLADDLRRLDPEDRELARAKTVIDAAHAQAMAALGRWDAALPLLRAVAESRGAESAAAPADFGLLRSYAVARAMLADAYADAGRSSLACPEYALAVGAFERLDSVGKLSQLDRDHGLRLARERQAAFCAH